MAILRRKPQFRSDARRRKTTSVAARRRLFFEMLEDRRVLSGTQATVYVDDGFAGNLNDPILDADLGTTGNQAATFGVNAFNTIGQALTALTTNGTVIVNGGTYAEAIALTGTQTLRITGPNAAQTVVIGSLATVAGQMVNIVGSSSLTIGDGSNTTIAGTITGSGSLTKQGAGTVTLSSGSSSYTGATIIHGGTLRLEHVNATGTTSGVTVNDTGVLELVRIGAFDSSVFYARPVILNHGSTLRGVGNGVNYRATGYPMIASGATVNFATVSANPALPDILRIETAATNAAGSNSTPTINITGPGTVALQLGSNDFRGHWNLSDGTLRVLANNSFGNPTASGALAGSTLTFSGGNLLIRSDNALSFNGGSATNIPVTVSADATITMQRNSETGIGVEHGFGDLSIGSYALTVTRDSTFTTPSVNTSIAFLGTTTLTGNAVFRMSRGHSGGPNQLLRLKGGITDGGSARTVTFDNSGDFAGEAVALVEGTRTLQAGTRLDLTGNQNVRLVLVGASASDNASVRYANTAVGTGAILDLRSNLAATFNNNLILDADGELRQSRTSQDNPVNLTFGNITVNGNRTLIVATGSDISNHRDFSFIAGAVSLNGDATFHVANNGNGTGRLNVAGAITQSSGARSVTKAGPGTLVLSGSAANTYTGSTFVNSGYIRLEKTAGVNAIPADLVVSNGGVVFSASHQIADTATVTMSSAPSVFNGTGANVGAVTVAETIANLIVHGGIFNTGQGSNWTVTGAASFTGGEGNTIFVGHSGTTVSFGGLSLLGMTAEAGSNPGATNTFTLYGNNTSRQSTITVGNGGLTLDGSRLNIRRGSAAGALGSRLILNGGVTTTGSAASFITEDAAGGTFGTIAVQLSGTSGAATRTISVGGGADLTIGVPIANGAATPGSLTKTGGGTLTLTAANTYSGATSIDAGRLALSHASNNNLPSSTSLDLAAGAELRASGLNASRLNLASGQTLRGVGTVTGSVTALSGSSVAPGSSPGILTIDGSLALNSGSTLAVEIGGTAAGSGAGFHDRVDVTGGGTVTIGNATLAPSLFGGFVPDSSTLQSFVIIDNGGTNAVSGSFSGLSEGSPVAVGASTLYVAYTNNQVVLNSQPVINGTDGADTLILRRNAANTAFEYKLNAYPFIAIGNPAAFQFHGGEGDDLLIADFVYGNPIPGSGGAGEGIFYDGGQHGTRGDVLQIKGSGTQAATYSPSATTAGAGTVTFDGRTVNFVGLEPVDLIDLALVNFVFPNADDEVTVTDGKDAATGLLDSLIVSGASGGVGFATTHLRGNAAVVIDTVTGGSDGDDSVTILGGAAAHGNGDLTIGTGDGDDSVDVTGSLTVGGDVAIHSQSIQFLGGTIAAGPGKNVTLNAGSGAISTSGSGVDVAAQSLTASATIGIDLDTAVGNVTLANHGAGNVQIDATSSLELRGLFVQDGHATIQTVGSLTSAPSTTINVSGQASLTAAAIALGQDEDDTTHFGSLAFNSGGAVAIREDSSTIVSGASTAGAGLTLTSSAGIAFDANVAVTGIASIASNGDISQPGGSVQATSLLVTGSGNTTLNQAANDVGTLAVDRIDGTFSFTDADHVTVGTVGATSGIATGSGAVILSAGGDITLGRVTTTGEVRLTAIDGAIIAAGLGGAEIAAGSAALRAKTGIGDDANALDLAVGTLAASTDSGDIHLVNQGGLTIGTVDGLGGLAIQDTGDHNSGSDHIRVRADGPITIAAAVVNHAGGNIVLAAEGTADTDNLTADANISATGGSGSIRLFAGNSIRLTDAVTVSAVGDGAVLLSASTHFNNGALLNGFNASSGTDGRIAMDDGSAIQSESGDITLRGDGDVLLSVVTSVSGELTVTADYDGPEGGLSDGAGAILDNTLTEAVNLATGGTATLSAGSGIGSAGGADDIDTQISTLVATNSTSGNIFVEESNGLVVGGAGVRMLDGNGHIGIVVSLGDLTLNSDVSAHGSGAINMTAAGGSIAMSDGTTTSSDAGDITVSAAADVAISLLASLTGNIFVTAGAGDSLAGAIIENTNAETPNLVTSGRVTLEAETGIGSAGGAADIDISAGELVATNRTAGNIFVRETDGLTIVGTGARTLAGNGTIGIRVDAGDLTVSGPVAAHGSGAIGLNADAGSIAMADGTTAASGSGAITLNAQADITLGGVATAGVVVATAATGAILDGGDLHPDIIAGSMALRAATGIGSSDAIETSVNSLAAVNSTSGNIDIVNLVNGLLTIGIVDGLSGAVNAAVAGTLSVSSAGSLTVTDSAAGTTAEVSAEGAVTLTAIDAIDREDHLTVVAGAIVRSVAGRAELRAGDNLTLANGSIVAALSSTIVLRGDFQDEDGSGSVMQLLGTLIAASGDYQIQVFGGPNADQITLNPGGSDSAASTVIDGDGGNDEYFIHTERLDGGANAALVTDSGGGTDRATVYATAAPENIDVDNNVADPNAQQTGGFVRNITTGRIVRYTATLETLTVRSEDGTDTFLVKPSRTTEITVHGGTPTFGDSGIPPGDTLTFNSYDNTFLIVCGTIHTDHPDDPASPGPKVFQPVHYRNIEHMPLDPLGTTVPLRFDMDATLAGTQTNYLRVLPTTLYQPGVTTHGWDAPVNGFDRGTAGFTSTFADLLRDGHWSSAPRRFTAEVADGWYLVSVKTGDKSFRRDQFRVTHGDTGQILLDGVATPAGQIAEHTFVMLVRDGTLDLTFSNMGGDPYWVLNGIEIRPGNILTFGSPETDVPLIADGVTQTTFFGYKATPGALVTIDPQLDTLGDHRPETTLTIAFPPDADPDVLGHQVWADVHGEFSYTVVHPSAVGTMRARYAEVTGAQASCFSVDFVAPSIRRFDFNSDASPTQAPLAATPPGDPFGYVGVLPTQLTSPGAGYGWLTAAAGFARGELAGTDFSNLLRDGAWSSGPRDFRMQLQPGTYDVTVTFGDASFARDRMQVTVVAGSGAGLTNVATAAGQFVHGSFTASTDARGELVLRFSDAGGDPYWTVNAVEARPSQTATALTVERVIGLVAQNPQEPLPADATTDTFRVTGATIGDWYTLSTDWGQIVPSQDQDARYAGVQVRASASEFTFTVRRGTSAVTANVRIEQIGGTSRGATTQVYRNPAVRRFDFNGSGNATQADFTGIRGNHLYTASNGYGWTQAVSEFQRASAAKTSVDLYRDGHWGSAAQTFRVAADNALTYGIRVYLGDPSFARNFIQVSTDGFASHQTAAATGANQFTTVVFTNVTPTDGLLNISIRNAGGDPYWVVNGIDVWTGTDPAEAPLLAGARSEQMVGGWLTEAAVAAVVPAAREYWISAGLNDVQLAELDRTPIAIGDLSYRGALGVTRPEGVWLDASGAGLGWNVVSGQWSVVSGQLSGTEFFQMPTANGQLPAMAYDLLTVLTHELGHVLGYEDLDAEESGSIFPRMGTVRYSSSDHIMVGVLQPGVSRLALPAGDFAPTWILGASSSRLLLDRPAASGRGLLDGRGLAVDRVLEDLLRDDRRGVTDARQDAEQDDWKHLIRSPRDNGRLEVDDFFARLAESIPCTSNLPSLCLP
ncbi:MAG: autotransporter-associated beta strand repeat-containing protein [Pirellulaceae bacterium]|nr:autotransporter-associated beta strand repeat-containing protein [Pirellulaceae bacterium]